MFNLFENSAIEAIAKLSNLRRQTWRRKAKETITFACTHNLGKGAAPALSYLGWRAANAPVMYPPQELLNGLVTDPTESVSAFLERVYREAYELGKQHRKLVEADTAPGGKLSDFTLSLRRPVMALWRSDIERSQFISEFSGMARRGLTRAWMQGIAQCGFTRDELDSQDVTMLELRVNNLYVPYVDALADEIMQQSRGIGKLGPFSKRVNTIWANRYEEMFTFGKALACSDRKAEWKLGVAEHCSSCVKLNGKVKRMSYWVKYGILPRVAGAEYLECKGYNCQCTLHFTNKPLTPGPLPNLP